MKIEIKNPAVEHEILIVGGGPSGCAAAIAAARQGRDVLVIEGSTALGGMGTMGMVSRMNTYTDKEKVIYRSIPVEILDRYKERVGFPKDFYHKVPLEPETLKVVLDDMLAEAGAKVLFASQVCAVETKENGDIDCVIVANKAGLTPYRAKIYVDCTGDGDVAAMAGVPYDKGAEDGRLQPCSLCFSIVGLKGDPTPKELNGGKDTLWSRIVADGKYPMLFNHFVPVIFGTTLYANAGHIFDVDSTDPVAVSAAYAHGRKLAEQYLAALKEYRPDVFSEAQIGSTAPLLGVRESRRIHGEYTFSVDDYLARRSFDDEIGRNANWMDCHGGGRKKTTATDHQLGAVRYEPGESHGIPWRCLVPVGIDNLLVAGRCLSSERMANATLRVMPNCLATGEAAGLGAAVACEKGIGAHEIDAKDVQERIR